MSLKMKPRKKSDMRRPCQGSELGQNKCVRGKIDITNHSKESPACIDLDVVPTAENNWKVSRCSLNETLSIGILQSTYTYPTADEVAANKLCQGQDKQYLGSCRAHTHIGLQTKWLPTKHVRPR
jgi:hypothetical protein